MVDVTDATTTKSERNMCCPFNSSRGKTYSSDDEIAETNNMVLSIIRNSKGSLLFTSNTSQKTNNPGIEKASVQQKHTRKASGQAMCSAGKKASHVPAISAFNKAVRTQVVKHTKIDLKNTII
ncbi:MAG: hypothetical protein ABIQ31_08000 [Ferruginibacter sp.]